MLVNQKTGEIFIYDFIGPDWFGEGITDQAVIQALDQLGGKRATVRINSPGGDANHGIAIYNALKRHPAGVDTVVDSLAASAASIIALAGEKRTTAIGGKWMIHRAMTIAIGNAVDMAKVVTMLDLYDRTLVEIYATRMTEKDGGKLMAMMTEETWFTGDEAVLAGLSTGREDKEADAPNVAAWFRHPPQSLFEKPKSVAKFAVRRQAAALHRSVVR